MTRLGNKMKRITGVATAAAAASVIGLTTLGAGAAPVMAATTTNYITQTKAKTAALNHAKVSTAQAYDVDIDLERGRSQTYYDVEFKANGYEYDYQINATNATVINSYKKALKTTKTNTTTTAKSNTNKNNTANKTTKVSYIGTQKAQSIALSHAKLTAAKVTGLKAELDRENGVYIYDVDFKSGNYEYDYDINATTGKIIKSQKKAIKKATNTTKRTTAATTTVKTSYIGIAKAKTIALNHAKVSASKARGVKAELDRERGIYVYEVEFKSGRFEYDYTINATTGKVISFDKEYDD